MPQVDTCTAVGAFIIALYALVQNKIDMSKLLKQTQRPTPKEQSDIGATTCYVSVALCEWLGSRFLEVHCSNHWDLWCAVECCNSDFHMLRCAAQKRPIDCEHFAQVLFCLCLGIA